MEMMDSVMVDFLVNRGMRRQKETESTIKLSRAWQCISYWSEGEGLLVGPNYQAQLIGRDDLEADSG